MNKRLNQSKIFNAVCSRGYGPKDQGLTADQFAARQVAKLLEEAMELAGEVSFPERGGRTLAELIFIFAQQELTVEKTCKLLFDDLDLWQTAEISDNFNTELADVAVPAACAAQVQGVSLMALGADKAMRDAARGVRKAEKGEAK